MRNSFLSIPYCIIFLFVPYNSSFPLIKFAISFIQGSRYFIYNFSHLCNFLLLPRIIFLFSSYDFLIFPRIFPFLLYNFSFHFMQFLPFNSSILRIIPRGISHIKSRLRYIYRFNTIQFESLFNQDLTISNITHKPVKNTRRQPSLTRLE